MKILHVNKFFDLRGGAEVYLHRLMSKQTARGHEVHAFSTHASQNLPSADERYFVRRYDFSRHEGVGEDARKAAAFLWNSEAKGSIARMISEVKPDVVHLHNVYHHLSTSILDPIRASGIRCVQTLHDYKLACPNYSMFTGGQICERCKGGKYWNAMTHRCLFSSVAGGALGAVEMGFSKARRSYESAVHRFIAPSEFLHEKMLAWGEPASKFVVIRNPADVPASAGPRGGGYVLGVGRLTASKGFETLVRAAARVSSVAVRIAGTGPDEDRLKHIARTLGAVNVSFLGFMLPDALTDLRRRADAVAVPSVWYENSPLAVLEALADGIPVLASNIGAIPELVRDNENGLLAAPGDVAAWAACLEVFAALPEDRRRAMGERGRDLVKANHGWEEHLSKLEEIYR